ncbi:MAG: hypothetical protein IPJ40_20200 [Saprospirales bacterium]|nr:hypothetical protein [Saprospirales bacterium]
MKHAYVFTETPDASGLIRKTVVVKETVLNAAGQETETFRTFVIILEVTGLLHDHPVEIPLTEEIPEINFIDGHTIPVSTPNRHVINLDIDDPDNSAQGS